MLKWKWWFHEWIMIVRRAASAQVHQQTKSNSQRGYLGKSPQHYFVHFKWQHAVMTASLSFSTCLYKLMLQSLLSISFTSERDIMLIFQITKTADESMFDVNVDVSWEWSRSENGLAKVTMGAGLNKRQMVNVGHIISVSSVFMTNTHKRLLCISVILNSKFW